jgi:hypothetical protein
MSRHKGTVGQSLNITVSGDVVDIITTTVGMSAPCCWDSFFVPRPPTAPLSVIMREFSLRSSYTLDGQPRPFEWGDIVPAQTALRTVSKLQDAVGFEVVENFNTVQRRHRWVLSQDGDVMIIESVVPGEPVNPAVRVFVKRAEPPR